MKINAALLPILTILVLTVFAIMLQSCGIVEVQNMQAPPITRAYLEVNVAIWVFGITIAFGAYISWNIYHKISKLEDKIKQLNHGE